MTTFDQQLQKANRLAGISQKIGFTLWQLQELEGIAAQCFVLLAQAEKGMGVAAGNALVDTAQRKTFGSTVHKFQKAGLLNAEVERRFDSLLAERNWLVHNSRATSRNAVHKDEAAKKLGHRLDDIASEALALMKELGAIAERFVCQHGISAQDIDLMSRQLLEQWHDSE